MSEPILHQGDVVTCEDGHEVCTVRTDLFAETVNWGAHFTNWKQKEPTAGEWLPLYCACGAAYMVQPIGPVHAHIEGRGWVPPIPEDLGPVPRKGEL